MSQQFGKPFALASRSLTSLCIAAGLAIVAASPSAQAHATKPHPFKSASITWHPGSDNRETPARLVVAHDGNKYTHVTGIVTTRFRLKAKVKSGKRIYGWVVTTGDPEFTASLPAAHIGAQDRVREKSLNVPAKFAMDAKTVLATGTPGISLTAEQDIVAKCNAKFPELPSEEQIVDRMDLTVHGGFSAGKKRAKFSIGGGWYNNSSSGRPAIAHTTFPVNIICLGKPFRAAPAPPPPARAGNTLYSIDLKVTQRGETCPKDVTVTAYANYRWPTKSRMRMTVDGGFPKIHIAETEKVTFAGKTFHRAEAQFHYKLDPGQRTFKLTVDHQEKTHTETVEIKCPPFKVLSAWLKYDVEQTPVCPTKVVETATFYTTRPSWVNH
jgi:hypothetical protein